MTVAMGSTVAFVRIVSLLPSTTEIVFQLGLGDDLLGVTFECNFPPTARQGREIVVGGIDTHRLTPLEIDELVRAKVAAGEDLYSLDEAALRRCDPDLILSQDLCRVCAVASGDVDEAVARLNCRAAVLQIDPQSLAEVIASVQTVADVAGVAARGAALVAALQHRLERLKARVDAGAGAGPRPRVFVLEWIDPPFVGGHWVPDVVAAAGAVPVLGMPGQRSVPSTWETIVAEDPDHVVVSPCGYGLDGAAEQARSVLHLMPQRAAVWAIDADAVMVRPGPRLVDGAEAVATAVFGRDVTGIDADHLIRRVG
jgi:iron complex transport system substrate-binding protein